MTHKLLITLSCMAMLVCGCRQYAYYQSPFQGNNTGYKVMPTHAEEPVSLHAGVDLYTGGSGDRLHDGSWGVNGNLYRSHSFGLFRAFYGVTGSLGSYRVRTIFSESPGKYPTDSIINARAGAKFFAGLGGTAGLYITNNFSNGGEWRVVGLELNYQNEFGNYLSFRQKLPDTAANINYRSKEFFTIGLHTDINSATRRGYAGIKLGGVFSTKKLTRYNSAGTGQNILPGYFSMTVHWTRDRLTNSSQFNFGTYVATVLFGISYRLD